MTTRERMLIALEGGTPDQTPLSIYNWMMKEPYLDQWRRILDAGLGICQHCNVVKYVEHDVVDREEEKTVGNDTFRIFTKATPVGTLRRILRNGWHHEDWIKTPADYKIRQWIVEHTELIPEYAEYDKAVALAGDYGVPVVTGSRTPAMSINIDWAGTTQFCLDLAAGVDELYELYEVQKKQFLHEVKLIAAGPGRFVKWFENLTIDMLGPHRYQQLLMQVYHETIPLLETSGKKVMVHYDGELAMIADQIATAPFHIVESLTEPPEGNMWYDECRRVWPEKILWGNVNVDLYYRPESVLKEAIWAKRERAGKRGFIFEISEQLPTNWSECIPVMLRALEELK